MCIVSNMVNDWQRGPNQIPGWWPDQYKSVPMPGIDRPIPKFPPSVTPDIARDMKDILERLDQLDKKMGNLECKVEEKVKAKIIEALTARAAGDVT